MFKSKESQKERFNICIPCEHLKYIPIINIAKCGACGCPIKTKIIPSNSSCPKGKW